jgi:hypothetical protein
MGIYNRSNESYYGYSGEKQGGGGQKMSFTIQKVFPT